MPRIAWIGDFQPGVAAHQAIPKALALSAAACNWPVPATPYRSTEGALQAIRFARESGRPLLGTCGGFQHALLEYARNVIGISGASHEETDPEAPALAISRLACSLVEEDENIQVLPSTRLRQIYGVPEIRERYRCRFGLNPAYRARLEDGGVRVSALAAGEVRAGAVHPLITAFVEAAQ